ncbi:hypothetical protein NP493_879g00043 [Ridgeia piscesae]|uniref:Uncharacterized protein n=1 Tax=Ridgeia piscesae TaxID=27915 RepID=A0AAD9KMX8_RIDPI|nr:hypothetical protein NP493_879g00043 [Ridgeia piscesae]
MDSTLAHDTTLVNRTAIITHRLFSICFLPRQTTRYYTSTHPRTRKTTGGQSPCPPIDGTTVSPTIAD